MNKVIPTFFYGSGETEFSINGNRYIYYTELWLQKKVRKMLDRGVGFGVINYLKKRNTKFVKIGD